MYFSVSSMSATTRQGHGREQFGVQRCQFGVFVDTLAIRNDFKQISVRVEEVEAVVIAPVNWSVGRYPKCPEFFIRTQEIVVTDLEGMMPFP